MCVNRDPYYATSRAGTLDRADAVLPWRVEDPPPPPVPPKREPSARPLAAAAAHADVPKRVTPWLLRRVKTPVAQDAHVTHDHHLPQKVSSSSANVIRGSPAPAAKPPSYQQQQQQPESHPREETFRVVPRQQQSKDSVAVKAANRPVVVSSIKVLVHTPSKPALPDKPDRSEACKAPSSSHFPTPQPSSGSLHEERRRPAAATAPRPTRPPQAKPSHPPSYHHPEPFPAPPPYRVSPEGSSPSPPSSRSRSLPRSRKHSPAFQKDAPLPALPSHPPLSASAMSRVQAAYKVSKQFGDAVMQQEARLAIPRTDYMPPVPASTPRTARRFMSAAELDSHRKARLRGDKSSHEQEARQRVLSKPSFYSERYAGDSRQRATSANSGRGYP